MAYINHQDLALLNELLADNLTAWGDEEESVKEEHAELIERLQAFGKKMEAVNNVADPELIEKARNIHADDECEIDDESVGVSESDDGTWVNAWVWVPIDDVEEEEEEADA